MFKIDIFRSCLSQREFLFLPSLSPPRHMRPQREFVFSDVSLGGYVVDESHLGREQMTITGVRQGDLSACVLGGAISHLNVETCCVRQLCCFKISFVSLI